MEKRDSYRGERLIVLSAPSGTGKNTVFDALQTRMPSVRRAITATTRAPRDGERDGVDYYFLSKEAFLRKAATGELAEQNAYADRYYGTPNSELLSKNGEAVVLIIDVNGKDAIKRSYPLATTVFLMPPSMEELTRRIIGRDQNSPDDIARRLAIAEEEMAKAPSFDHVLINDDVERCAAALAQVIEAVLTANGE